MGPSSWRVCTRNEEEGRSDPMRVNEIDLNLLIPLDALLSERSVTRAAERLYVGQSAMSASLARLRRVFNDPLLVRSGRSLSVLTPLAESLVQPVREVLGSIEHLLAHRAQFDPAVDGRSFTIAASDYATLVLLRHVLESLDADAPRLHLTVAPLVADYVPLLERGEIDFLVIPRELDPPTTGYGERRLFEDRFVCVAWMGNPMVPDVLSLDHLSSLPYLAYEGEQMQSLADTWLDAAGVRRKVEATAQTFVLGPLLIRGTRLISVVHARVAYELEAVANCRILELPLELPAVTETLIWNRRVEEDPAHRWMRERIATVAATLAPTPPSTPSMEDITAEPW